MLCPFYECSIVLVTYNIHYAGVNTGDGDDDRIPMSPLSPKSGTLQDIRLSESANLEAD